MKKYSLEPYYFLMLAIVVITALVIIAPFEISTCVHYFLFGIFFSFILSIVIMAIASRNAVNIGRGTLKTIDDVEIDEVFIFLQKTSFFQETTKKHVLIVILEDRNNKCWLVNLREKDIANINIEKAKKGDLWKVIRDKTNSESKFFNKIGQR